MAIYAVVNSSNVVVNLVEWDGVATFNPGAGLRLMLASSVTSPTYSQSGNFLVTLPAPAGSQDDL